MSIDDDSFDIEARLAGTDLEPVFDRFMRWAYRRDADATMAEAEKKSLLDAQVAHAKRLLELRAENAKAQDLIAAAIPYVRAAMQDAEVRHDDPESDTYMDGVKYEIMCECREWLDKAQVLIGEAGE